MGYLVEVEWPSTQSGVEADTVNHSSVVPRPENKWTHCSLKTVCLDVLQNVLHLRLEV